MKKRVTAWAFLCLLVLCLTSCGVPGVPQTDAQLPVVRSTATPQTLPPVRFPQDEAPHNDLTEWWYYTGHLTAVTPTGQQRQYGFELVFFQSLRSNLPPVYTAHFAITDSALDQFHYAQRQLTEPQAVIPNGTSTAGFNLSINDWSMSGLNGHDRLQASMSNYAIALNLTGLKLPVLHGGNGLITYGLGGFSYYYSYTRMSISGTLVDHQQTLQVTGLAWMDHQWGNFLALGGGGWDWFSMQLNNQSELMLYFIRDASGQIISTDAEYITPDAQTWQIPARNIQTQVLNHWTSPTTGITYPSGWQLTFNDPRLQANLQLQPVLQNQELITTQTTGNIYWEGAVTILGSIGRLAIAGQGYVELTGYQR
jgi:predicted secreted hydrolase